MTMRCVRALCLGVVAALATGMAAAQATAPAAPAPAAPAIAPAAQAPAAPAPRVRAELQAAQPLLVGQQVRLEVQILAPNFFTQPPPFPTIELPGAIVTMPDERGRNFVERIGGQTYAGILKSYLFTAQQAGEFVLPPAPSRFSYAGADGKPVPAQVQLPPLRISVRQPAGAAAAAAAGQGARPVARLHVTQTFDHSAGDGAIALQAGDALVRTVDVFAEMTQAMLIPPPHFDAPPGVRIFVADPQLSDAAPGGGSFVGGHRIDKVSYVFEQPGSYTLPAVAIDWFNTATQKTEAAQAPAVQVVVAARAAAAGIAPAAAPAAARTADTLAFWRRIHGWRWLVAFALVVAAVLFGRPWLQRRAPAWQAARARRHAARQASEAVMFKAVQAACRADDAPRTYAALLRWSRAHLGASPQAWAAQRQDGALARELAALDRRLFGPASNGAETGAATGAATGHSLGELGAALARARAQGLPSDPARSGRAHALPPLNPGA